MRGRAGQLGHATVEVAGAAVSAAPGEPAEEPLEMARAVRRSLADAGAKAATVTSLTLASELARRLGPVIDFTRLALGAHRSAVAVRQVDGDDVLATAVGAVASDGGLGIVLLPTPAGTLALCLSPEGAGRGVSRA